jgi:aminoglycoside phosphotransferase (APT) family kinase protein
MDETLAARLQNYLAEKIPQAVIANFHFMASGFESDVYSFDFTRPGEEQPAWILRLFSGEGAAEKIARESAGLTRLKQAGYPVPTLLLSETDTEPLGKPFTILERLDGGNLWPVLAQAEPARVDQLLEQFSSLLVDLHRIDWRLFFQDTAGVESDPGTLVDDLMADARRLYQQLDLAGFVRILDWLKEHKSALQFQPAVVHMDFHANNVFQCTDSRLVVIDWTQVSVCDYRVDLGWTLMIMGDLGNPAWGEKILQAYEKASGQPVVELAYFKTLAYLKLLASSLTAVGSAAQKEGTAQSLEPILRLAPIYREFARRIREYTGLPLPEVEAVFGQNSGFSG